MTVDPQEGLVLREVAKALDNLFNGKSEGSDRKVGFVLLTFNFHDAGKSEQRANYISNGQPIDMLSLFREQVARLEGRLEKGPTGPQ